MNRNKFIYASAYGAFVISSDIEKGGTWNGAIENIKNKWTKLFVWSGCKKQGNKELINKGGIPYNISNQTILEVIDTVNVESACSQMDMFTTIVEEKKAEDSVSIDTIDLYDVVKDSILRSIVDEMDAKEIALKCNVQKGQMTIWLKRLVDEGKLKKHKQLYSI